MERTFRISDSRLAKQVLKYKPVGSRSVCRPSREGWRTGNALWRAENDKIIDDVQSVYVHFCVRDHCSIQYMTFVEQTKQDCFEKYKKVGPLHGSELPCNDGRGRVGSEMLTTVLQLIAHCLECWLCVLCYTLLPSAYTMAYRWCHHTC